MLLVSAAEDTADPVGKLVSAEQPLGLGNLAFAMDPLRLDRVQPRALLGQKARNYPYPTLTGPDLAVVGGDPVAHLLLLLCQEALSQIRSNASLPTAASFSVQ